MQPLAAVLLYAWRSGAHAEDEVDNDSSQQEEAEHGGAKAVIVRARATAADGSSTPVVGHQSVGHSGHSDEGEETGRDATNLVTEVEETDGKTAKDDGEVEP